MCLLAVLYSCKGSKALSEAENPSEAESPSEAAEAIAVTPAEDPLPKALLWKITGQELTEPSYLYGTIHVIGSDDYLMLPEVEKAFEDSDQLALEIDMDDPGMLMAMMSGMNMKGDSSLADVMAPADYEKVHQFLIDSAGVPEMGMKQIERMMPMLALSVIYPKMLNGGLKSYEQEFVNMAKAQEKEILGVEKIEDQLAVFSQIPYRSQAKVLLEYANDFAEQKRVLNNMISLYLDQDIEGLLNLMDESDGGNFGDFEEILLEKRNRNWIPVIGQMATEKPTFFAVGSGHLAGEAGVIKLLKDAGYTVEPIL
ncbi:MAG: TraB/GumN family protein [Bacteroidota bacterium]